MQKHASPPAASLTPSPEQSLGGCSKEKAAPLQAFWSQQNFIHTALGLCPARYKLALCPGHNLPTNQIIQPWKMRNGSISCSSCKTTTLQQQWGVTQVEVLQLLLQHPADQVQHAYTHSLKKLVQVPEAKLQEGFLHVSAIPVIHRFVCLHPKAAVQLFLFSPALCCLTMSWFARGLLISTLIITSLLFSLPDIQLCFEVTLGFNSRSFLVNY